MTDQLDPTLQTLLTTLQPDNNLGVLLMVQMGGTPQELQLILQTTTYDPEKDALRTTGQYVLRALGVIEHKVALGLFNNLILSHSNPLMDRYEAPHVELYFRGTLSQADALMLELQQLYGQTYGIYRHMADEINHAMPLEKLLTSGYGALGVMPQPFAEKVCALFARYGLQTSLLPAEVESAPMKHQLLVMDDSYLIAQAFSADPMGMGKTP